MKPAVYCNEHGLIELSDENYQAQLMDADEFWKCPICGEEAAFDDESVEPPSTVEPTDKHREETREPERIRVCIRAGKDDWIGIAYSANAGDPDAIHEYVSASALSSRDREIRKVLEGLRAKCWCVLGPRLSSQPHDPRCLAARGLWNAVQGSD